VVDANSAKRLFLLDAHSHLHRAYHAVSGLSTKSGFPTGALFGFLSILNRIVKTHSPAYLGAVYDAPGPTFRVEEYADYKIHRPPMPEDLRVQVEKSKEILDAMGIPRFEVPGFEADDLLATLCRQAGAEGVETWIVSVDKDLFQLIGPLVKMLRYHQDKETVVDAAGVRERFGVDPAQMADYLGLVGDSSDNIPGVPGIGPKAAAPLLAKFGSIEGILTHLDEVEKPRWRTLLAEHAEQARLSRRLALLRTDAPVSLHLGDLAWRRTAQSPHLRALLQELEFRSLIERPASPSLFPAPESPAPEAKASQQPTPSASEVSTAPAPSASSAFSAANSPMIAPKDKDKDKDYGCLRTAEDLRQFAAEARQARRMAVDTETTGLDPFASRLVGISVSIRPGQARYIPVGHDPAVAGGVQPTLELVREILGPVLADPAVEKIFHHYQFDYKFLTRAGFALDGVTCDTMLASYLLYPEGRLYGAQRHGHGLKSLAQDLLQVDTTSIHSLIGEGELITMEQVDVAEAAPYACQDADLTLRLADVFAPALENEHLTSLLREIEVPLAPVLAEMEMNGVRIDLNHFARLEKESVKTLRELERKACDAAGRPFNPASPKQVAQILFEHLKLTAKRRGKTGYSTDVDVLEELRRETRHPLLGILLEHRAAGKLLSTYISALPRMVHSVTGRIHTSFNPTATATGRLSSSEPNLQNIPARTPQGREIRRGFIPSEGRMLLAADYSQIELRLLAHASGDAGLVEAFRTGGDIHRATAARVFRCAPEAVTDDMRSRAKTVNFGVVYGISAHGLSIQLGISHGEAQKFIDDYFAAYPGVKAWIEGVIDEARRDGYVASLCGRRRTVADLNSSRPQVRSAAERIAVNTPIQGSAADMIKIAMIALHSRLRRERLRSLMILQVHDELIFDAPEDEVERLSAVVREEMENAMPLKVPVKVDIKTGRNWAEC